MSVSTEVVTVSIVLATRAPSAKNFGTAAVFAKTPYVGGRLYELAPEGLAQMVTDGFTVNDRAYKLVSSMASQSPHTSQVLVYKRSALTTNVLNLTPLLLTVGAVYAFSITYKGVTSSFSYTVTTGTVDAICDGLEGLINASAVHTAGVTAAGDVDPGTATKLILTGGTTGEPVQISGLNPTVAKILDVSTDAGIATDLAAAAADTNSADFYGFVIDSYSEAENDAAAAWAEANGKIFVAQSACSTNVLDAAGTGVGQDFFAAKYNRSTVVHNGDMPGNAGACLLARQLALDPGTSSAAFKDLAGPAADALTGGQIVNAEGKNIIIYALDDGTAHTFFGKMASGRAMRVQMALDLIDARVREAILAAFMSNEYIPMSDAGFAVQEAAVRGVLNGLQIKGNPAAPTGFILPGSITVTTPKASTLSSSDLTAGKLNSLRFGCIIPNDMTRVVVNGSVAFA